MKKLSLFNKILFSINTLLAIGLLLACVIPHLAPEKYGVLSVFSLLSPLLILSNVIFVVYWVLIGFKKQFLQSLIVLVISYFALPSLYKFMPKEDIKNNSSISLLTYNVRKFNKYNWLEKDSVSIKIQQFIEKEDPDLVLLQEFEKNNNFNLNYPFTYNHYSFNYFKKTYIQSGLITYSKYPIVASGAIGNGKFVANMVYTDVVKNSDTIRIINFHMASLGVDPNKEFLGQKDSETLLKRLRNSFRIQGSQIDSLTQLIASNKRTILVGDLNNTPYSWAYKKIKANFSDTFEEKGQGFGKTYALKSFPLRIDYIFTDPSINILSHRNYDLQLSDHFPVLARFNLN